VAVKLPLLVANVLMSIPKATSGNPNPNVIVSVRAKFTSPDAVRPSVFGEEVDRNSFLTWAVSRLEMYVIPPVVEPLGNV
jgi:hypothetical protein